MQLASMLKAADSMVRGIANVSHRSTLKSLAVMSPWGPLALRRQSIDMLQKGVVAVSIARRKRRRDNFAILLQAPVSSSQQSVT